MTQPPASRRTTFSVTTSWVGLLLLGAGISQVALAPSQANSPGPQTSSIEFSSINELFGVFGGGAQKDFTTGIAGWQAPAFEALGMMGMEWTTVTGTEARSDLSPDPGTSVSNPGGESSWTSRGYLSANPNNQIITDKTISASGNQVRFSLRHRSLINESAINRRLFWIAELASGYDPVYSGAGTSTVLVTDASGTHPTLILHVTSTAGTPTFEGGTSIYTPLSHGDRSPTMYVLPGESTDFTMEITVGIVDADPCSTQTANSFATNQPGVYGQAWDSFTGCATDVTWEVTADGEPSTTQFLSFLSPYVSPLTPLTKTLSISGLPDGVTWERTDDSGSSIGITLRAPSTVDPGAYPLTLIAHTSNVVEGVTTLSQPSSASGTLTVLAPPPPAEPESTESTSAPSATTAPSSQSELIAPPAEPRVSAPTKEETRVVPERPLSAPQDVSPDPTGPPESVSPSSRTEKPELTIPEPQGAGVWLGVGTGLLASGGIVAGLRRRFRRLGALRRAQGERNDPA
jgi:hypothetical protein